MRQHAGEIPITVEAELLWNYYLAILPVSHPFIQSFRESIGLMCEWPVLTMLVFSSIFKA